MISPRSARSHRDPISRDAIRDAHSPAPQDFREYVSLIPTSAHTGEGVPDILMLLVQITQKMMVERIMWTPLVQCTVLEVKVVEGLGATADVILANGTLKRGDRIVMCGFGGAVVTRVRELLTPKPLREIRVKTDYLHHQSVDGAAGIKICANRLDSVVAGSACMVRCRNPAQNHRPAVNRANRVAH